MADDERDICATCGDKRRSGEPSCLRCGTGFPDPDRLPKHGVRVVATAPDSTDGFIYLSDELPEKVTDFFQYLSYFSDCTRVTGALSLKQHFERLRNYLDELPEAQREGMAVYILDNLYRGAASVTRIDRALYDYVSELGRTVASFLSSGTYAYVIDNSYDNPDRLDVILAILKSFGLVVSCPEEIAVMLTEKDSGAKVRPLHLPDWPRYAAEAWHVALAVVQKASSERRPLAVLSLHFDKAALTRVRDFLNGAGYTVVYRNEAPRTGSGVGLWRA